MEKRSAVCEVNRGNYTESKKDPCLWVSHRNHVLVKSELAICVELPCPPCAWVDFFKALWNPPTVRKHSTAVKGRY